MRARHQAVKSYVGWIVCCPFALVLSCGEGGATSRAAPLDSPPELAPADPPTPAEPAESKTGWTAVPGAGRFDPALRDQPCKLLTAEMVAAASGEHPALHRQRSSGKMCAFHWDGGMAELRSIKIERTPKMRETGFRLEHRAAFAARAETTSDGGTDGKPGGKPGGKTNAKGKKARAKSPPVGPRYEFVPDLGDGAILDATRTERKEDGETVAFFHNVLAVRISNLSFELKLRVDGRDELLRDELLKLGRAIVEDLSGSDSPDDESDSPDDETTSGQSEQ